MKLVYLGTDAFYGSFVSLARQHKILALYSCGCAEDYFRDTQIRDYAARHGIAAYRSTITREEEAAYLDAGCQLFISADYGRKIPLLPEAEGYRAVNLHASLLPEGRSYCPIECAMERGLERTGVTIHKLAEAWDAGDILLQREIAIAPEEDSVDLYLKCDAAARSLLEELLGDFEQLWAAARPQKQLLPYWRIERIREARLFHTLTVAEAERRWRIYNRMVRVKLGERVYYVQSVVFRGTRLAEEELWLGEGSLLYGLCDGHLRLELREAERAACWEAERYPFPVVRRYLLPEAEAFFRMDGEEEETG